MSDMATSAGVPEVIVGQTAPQSQGVPPTFSGKWEDMSKDMAAIEAELSPVQPAQPEPTTISQPPQAVVTQQAKPAPTQAPVPQPALQHTQQAAPVEVPDKFKTPEGTLDQEKLLKSYGEAERTLKRLQNKGGQQMPQATAPAQVQQAPQYPSQLTPFEAQVAQDIFNQGGFTEQQAIGLARIQVRLTDAKHQADTGATLSKIQQFEQVLEERNRREELETVAKSNPWIFTPKGQEELVRVRQENPWINESPRPWEAAVYHLLGRQGVPVSTGQVNMPTPTGSQQAAPPLPVTPAQPVANPIPLNTPQEIEAYVKTLNPKEEAEFWTKAGLKWEVPRQQFKGF